ncbi:MAG: hypothetical protein ACE5D8_07895, partial [Fidelibacterota bacterium]
SSENLWLDCESHVGAWRVGLFFGQVDNLGTGQALNENETAHLMARGTTIKRIARLAPRVSYLQNKFRLAYELEITRADYFSNLNLWFIPSGEKTDRINIRNLIAFYLFF